MKKFFGEYLLLNLFIFGCVSLLSLVILNFSIFDPFTEAFHDFTLTDLYYNKVQDKNNIYNKHLVLINAENKSRKELAFLLQQIQEVGPKVVALDIIFAQRKNEDDSLLQQAFNKHDNYVLGYAANFEHQEASIYTDTFFTKTKDGYINVAGEHAEFSTIRYYYPFNKEQEAFTSCILKKFNPATYRELKKKRNRQTEIHYYGNLANFNYFDFDEVMDSGFDVTQLKDKIILIGFLGIPSQRGTAQLEEDKLFTPLNTRLSGRSYPDMYGSVIHANILRMILENDHIRVIPRWLTAVLSFLLIWLLLPIMCGLFFKGDLWFNSVGTLLQLVGSLLVVFLTLLTYSYFNLKFDPGLLLACFVLLPTFINLYEALLNFLRHNLNISFHSAFLGTNNHA
ncbi:CHASE2 domain-containing protein [Lacibacter sediminis]|uniref:CHASE2 domain-containing protein n=1 Tax=Lacibacter sediminis TaxID=2760713 RepID=A0A7G5XII6_9BACT|nr:CHASE2 domain-containing protein [Lacibacter sediminis]QNA45289.1 CHASE2 domain-containing protein [Lacibacter sediminis]